MKKSTRKYFKLGRTFPPTGQGTGILILGIMSVLCYYHVIRPGYKFDTNVLYGIPPTFLGLFIVFSSSRVYYHKLEQGYLINRYGLFPVFFFRKIKLENYDAAVIKKTYAKYRTRQGVGAGMVINSTEFTDSFIGLHFKLKGKREEELILKGKGQDVMQFIEDHLINTHLLLFVGVIKKGYELKTGKKE